MNIIFKEKIKNYVISLLKNISGIYVYQFIDFLNIYLTKKNFKDKGLLGRLIEMYIVKKKIRGNICDINYLNWECKTVFLNNFFSPNNDVLLLTFKFLNFFTLNFKRKFFLKIKKILWIPILGNKNIIFLYRIIGDFFLTYLSKKNISVFWKELNKIINFILNKDIILNNFYSKNFRLQFFPVKKNNFSFNLNDYYIGIYLNKFFLENIFLNFRKNV